MPPPRPVLRDRRARRGVRSRHRAGHGRADRSRFRRPRRGRCGPRPEHGRGWIRPPGTSRRRTPSRPRRRGGATPSSKLGRAGPLEAVHLHGPVPDPGGCGSPSTSAVQDPVGVDQPGHLAVPVDGDRRGARLDEVVGGAAHHAVVAHHLRPRSRRKCGRAATPPQSGRPPARRWPVPRRFRSSDLPARRMAAPRPLRRHARSDQRPRPRSATIAALRASDAWSAGR
jgi:hypothetical protein